MEEDVQIQFQLIDFVMQEVNSKVSKSEAKLDKLSRKQEGFFISRRQAQLQLKNLETEQKCQTLNLDPLYKKAIRWWQRLDDKYFRTLHKEEVAIMRDNLTSDKILTMTSNQLASLLTYRQQMIESQLSTLSDSKTIKVLFKSTCSPSLMVYDLSPCIPHAQKDEKHSISRDQFTLTPNNNHKMIDQKYDQPQLTNDLKNYQLQHVQSTQDFFICHRIQKYNEIIKKRAYIHEIDQQIALWEWELKHSNHQSIINWNRMIAAMINQPQEMQIFPSDMFDDQIDAIKERLLWKTILRYFQNGFSDKTRKMLDNCLQVQKFMNSKPMKGSSQSKFFETDCKICFCSYNNDSNQVLYCDLCNTSYHLACYGLQYLPQQQKYYCDRCLYIRKQEQLLDSKIKKINCQICGMANFPMKNIDDHFYHVTCLVLFNFVEFRQGRLKLKGSLSHHNIVQMVIENELKHEECNCCRKSSGNSLGMQLCCAYDGCNNSVHPICGYLSGCRMNVKKNGQNRLLVEVFCNRHGSSRMEQAYLRRYMCNLKQTSSKTMEQFDRVFSEEEHFAQNLRDAGIRFRKKFANKILHYTKFLKHYFTTKQKKQSSQILTQSQKMLQKVKNKI